MGRPPKHGAIAIAAASGVAVIVLQPQGEGEPSARRELPAAQRPGRHEVSKAAVLGVLAAAGRRRWRPALPKSGAPVCCQWRAWFASAPLVPLLNLVWPLPAVGLLITHREVQPLAVHVVVPGGPRELSPNAGATQHLPGPPALVAGRLALALAAECSQTGISPPLQQIPHIVGRTGVPRLSRPVTGEVFTQRPICKGQRTRRRARRAHTPSPLHAPPRFQPQGWTGLRALLGTRALSQAPASCRSATVTGAARRRVRAGVRAPPNFIPRRATRCGSPAQL